MKNKIYKLIALCILVGSIVVVWFVMDYRHYASNTIALNKIQGMRYIVSPGTSLGALADDLHEKGVINKPYWFVWMARLKNKAGKIQAGEYQIMASMTSAELLDLMISGQVISHSLTLVEGWTFRQMLLAIGNDEYLLHTINDKTPAEVMALIGAADLHPEGQFLPDTYQYSRGMTDVAFLKRAHAALQSWLDAQWQQRAPGLPFETPYEALILASIIEKETGLADERDKISGVFIRRLKKRMYLQTDPTVIYGMGDNYQGNIRRKDLRADTPYNTYTRKGLPPTPIAMPGKEAIYAALHPSSGKALYFVARGDGSHQFSDNLRDHNNAVIKYQLRGKRRAFSSMPGNGKNTQ
ncbi:MAG: endolytic transglycosylase MltG [Gammaproteobacteria bacterium]|nr:MAG: endolytic transglycosylase MltG [Gammaproteobacteria bacterium]